MKQIRDVWMQPDPDTEGGWMSIRPMSEEEADRFCDLVRREGHTASWGLDRDSGGAYVYVLEMEE